MTTTDSITCPVCGRGFRVITTQHIRTHGFPDAASFKAHFGLAYLRCAAVRQAHSAKMAANNPMAGRSHSPEARRKMGRNRKGKGVGVAGKYERTPEIRSKISQGVIRHFQSVGCSGRGQHVYAARLHREVWVRSSWEVRVIKVLDLHPCVLDYEYEPYSIPYEWEGSRLYVPDFKVVLEGGITELWEVKPAELRNRPRNKAKETALNAFCRQHGLNARVVTASDLEGMERQVGLLPWEGEGGPWVRPDDPDFRPRSPAEQRGLPDDR